METSTPTKIITDDLIWADYKLTLNKRNSLGLLQFYTQVLGNCS
ncbi:hypothetical protein LCGC14_0550190 [marine sediment metagenome]|uniref:Uncharacterized protein n=1 Tax=marine sediment metagenome TaxID=412755 RepID=A0A0F9S8P5_9ZZZZ